MTIGKALARARIRNQVTQEQLSFEIPVSREGISKNETGKRKVQQDIRPLYAKALDDGFLAMAIAREDTGGSWVRELDGDNVDLHRSSVAAKTLEELVEAIEAIKGICIANQPQYMKDHQIRQLEETAIQAIDGITALSHYVAVICDNYKLSWNGLWKKHTAKLVANGYLKKESARA